jgi:glucokinase
MKPKFYIGIDIGGTKISAGLVNDKGRIILRQKISTPHAASPSKTIRVIRKIIEQTLAESGLHHKDICGIGIGIPGLVNSDKGTVIVTPNMNLTGKNIVREIGKYFHIPIRIGNDVNLGLLGEKWLGAAKNKSNAIAIFLGTGIGGGVIEGGKLLTGYQGVAAEIGHMSIDPNGPKCSCGNRGCLEAFAGRWAIERDIKKAVHKGQKSKLGKLKNRKTIKSRLLGKALRINDPLITPIMKGASKRLGQGCVTLRHIFDPEIIILGGGVAEACGYFIKPIVEKAIKADRFFRRLKGCNIALSKLKDDAVILGAASLARSSCQHRE